MTACRRAPKLKSACVPSSSMSRRWHRACWRPTSSGSDLGRVRFARVRVGEPNLPPGCRRGFRYQAIPPGWCSTPRAFTSTPTAFWSRERRNGQDSQSESLVPGAAGFPRGGVLRHPAADDGGELFDPGHLRQQPVLLEWRRLVQGTARPVDRLSAAGSSPRCGAICSSRR